MSPYDALRCEVKYSYDEHPKYGIYVPYCRGVWMGLWEGVKSLDPRHVLKRDTIAVHLSSSFRLFFGEKFGLTFSLLAPSSHEAPPFLVSLS